ncbi:MAG: peptidoglycan DD-metalloendopeptidase family protein [Pyrinomonadaceae bacterium]
MQVSPIEQLNVIQPGDNKQSLDALRRAATQFEAILLMQLTAALNSTTDDGDDGEEKLFGGDGGTGLAKQMFSEQLATTMAQSGGVGLSDLILSKFGIPKGSARSTGLKGLDEAIGAVKDIKANRSAFPGGEPFINRSAKALPITSEAFTGNPDEAEVISTFEDQARAEGIEPSLEHLILNGRIVNTTRPRIANGPVRDITSASPISDNILQRSDETLTYKYPVSGRLSSGFGNRFHPIDRKTKFHAGLDLAVPLGTSVGASTKGVVKFAGWSGDYGNLVIIEHSDGRETRYGHLSKVLVSAGDKVVGGQQIALSGSTGKSTGPHVHFEVRENGKVVNPTKILSNVLLNTAER